MAKLFFSYSHKDEALRDELQVHLEMLKRSGAIEMWHDRMIPAGNGLDGEIDRNMEDADVILLLVSSDFLASKYCFDVEVNRAMTRHREGTARVIPVILRPCDWHHAPFATIMAAPTDGKPITKWPNQDEAFLSVVNAIRAGLPSQSQTSPTVFPPTEGVVRSASPRSSNLRLKQTFSEADRDRFLDESFEFIASYFEGSMEELKKRHTGIETRFKRIDAHCFTAVIYRNGDAVSRCSIRHGSSTHFGNGITYSHDDRAERNSMNEMLSVDIGDHSLSLKMGGMFSIGGRRDSDSLLSSEGAAELYWSMFMEPLQR